MAKLLRSALREYRGGGLDGRRWNDFHPRDDDIIVATYPKVGSTWMQRLLDMLIHQSTAPRPIMETYPWLDATFMGPVDATLAMLDGQAHRRSIKSHLPLDGLPIYDKVRYIHVARDGRDACLSQHNHQLGLSAEFKQRLASARPGGAPPPAPPEDAREFFLQWLASCESGANNWSTLPFFDFELTYWQERARPNLLLVHYNDLKDDLDGEIGRISAFLEIDTPPELIGDMARAGSFAAMKSDGAALLPGIGQRLDHGHERFLNKGTSGRWRDVLTADDVTRYEILVQRSLSPGAASWLEHGRRTAGDPRTAPN